MTSLCAVKDRHAITLSLVQSGEFTVARGAEQLHLHFLVFSCMSASYTAPLLEGGVEDAPR
jgi:hypothetical protein